MRITIFDEDINYELDEMIEERKSKWNPYEDKLREMRGLIGKLIANKEFLEEIHKDSQDDKIKELTEEIEKRISKYNEFKAECQPLADLLNKEIVILENLKRNY